MNTNNIKEELQEIAPFLAKVKKLDEIKQEVPYAYFERMPDRVMSQIHELSAWNQKEKNKSTFLQKALNGVDALFSRKMYLSFSIILLVGCFGYLFMQKMNQSKASSGPISKNEAIEYLLGNVDEIDETMLAYEKETSSKECLTHDQNNIKGYLEENLTTEELEEI